MVLMDRASIASGDSERERHGCKHDSFYMRLTSFTSAWTNIFLVFFLKIFIFTMVGDLFLEFEYRPLHRRFGYRALCGGSNTKATNLNVIYYEVET